jgi:hypothetical protein
MVGPIGKFDYSMLLCLEIVPLNSILIICFEVIALCVGACTVHTRGTNWDDTLRGYDFTTNLFTPSSYLWPFLNLAALPSNLYLLAQVDAYMHSSLLFVLIKEFASLYCCSKYMRYVLGCLQRTTHHSLTREAYRPKPLTTLRSY